ncbi:MAG: hypothetical protein ACO1QR_04290, partial [Chthoniobacteraceae bacterium]
MQRRPAPPPRAPDSSLPKRLSRALPLIRCGAAFLVCWAITCLLLREVQPLPPVPQVKEKLEWLAAAPEEYDTLFIGSSRVRR